MTCTMYPRNSGIDDCIKPLIEALNKQGHQTVASCCGHGYQPLRISLLDGREILILTYQQAQDVAEFFPGINGGQPRHDVHADDCHHRPEPELGA